MLPILLPYNEPGAVEIISMIGESGSAKEVIMAAQEAVERLKRSFEVDLEEPEVDEDGDRFLKRHSRNEQMTILVDLYTKSKYHLSHSVTPLFLQFISYSKIESSPQVRYGNAQTFVSRAHGCNQPGWRRNEHP
jgi:hypothetical protein